MASQWIWLSLISFNCLVHLVLPTCPAGFILGPPQLLFIEEGGAASLTCLHQNRGVSWYKETSIIDINSGRNTPCSCETLAKQGSGEVSVNFTMFSASSAGMYGCWAAIGSGEFLMCNFTVVLARLPEVDLGELLVVESVGTNVMIVPSSIHFGIPNATITWSNNGVILDPSTNDRISVDNATGTLMLTDFQVIDRGSYEIVLHNQVGSISDMIPVTTNFFDISVSSTQNGDEYILNCTAVGYPVVFIRWQHILTFPLSNMRRLYETVNTSIITIPSSACGSRYTCSVTTDDSGNEKSDSVLPCSAGQVTPPTSVNVVRDGVDGVLVTWFGAMGNLISGYRVRYSTQGGPARFMDYNSEDSSARIGSLTPGQTYSFEVGTLSSMGGEPMYASPQFFTLPPCSATVPSERVKNVNAALDRFGGMRTITISWNTSQLARYRLSISPSPSPSSSPFDMIFIETSYTLPTSSCDGSTYTFRVQVVNSCNAGGPVETVRQICSPSTVLGVTLVLVAARETHLELRIGILNPSATPSSTATININATNLIPFPEDGTIVNSMYIISSYPTNGEVCIKDLRKDTSYRICIDTVFLNGEDGRNICINTKTATDGGIDPAEECLVPVMFISEKTASVTFPEWAIAVIVVGVVGMVTLVFCFIGLFFACNTSKSKEDIYGSTSSLQANSVTPGMVVQTHHHMQNHRDVSPPGRSCLSYHSKGHSTNWNEHRDTLRQMDTDKGTNV